MSEFISNNSNKIGAGLGITILLIIIFSFANAGVFNLSDAREEPSVIITGGGSGSNTTISCVNVGTGSNIIKNTTSNICYARSILGSSDISVTQQTNTIVIDYNGSSSESTQCINVGSGTIIIKNSTSGNCYVKTLVNGNGVILSNGTNTITITNSGVLSNIAGNGISVNQTTGNVLITNTKPEDTSCINIGSGTIIIKNTTSNDCYVKSLLAGKGLTISNGTNEITYATNFVNGTGISITGTTSQTFTNTGVISGSCSLGISCSGTNPLTITPTYQLLCQNSLGSSASSLSCSSFTGKAHLYIEYTLYGVTANYLVAGTFNSDSATNYSYRLSNNYAADTGAVSRKNFTMNGNTLVASGTMTGYLHCENDASHRKLCNGENTTDANTDAATTVNYSAFSIKWSNTANQITTVSIVRGATGTGNLNTGSNISVWGYD